MNTEDNSAGPYRRLMSLVYHSTAIYAWCAPPQGRNYVSLSTLKVLILLLNTTLKYGIHRNTGWRLLWLQALLLPGWVSFSRCSFRDLLLFTPASCHIVVAPGRWHWSKNWPCWIVAHRASSLCHPAFYPQKLQKKKNTLNVKVCILQLSAWEPRSGMSPSTFKVRRTCFHPGRWATTGAFFNYILQHTCSGFQFYF